MNHSGWLLPWVVVLACCDRGSAASGSQPPAREAAPDDVAAHRLVAAQLAAVLERQREAWNRGDIVAFMDAYVHDDSLVFTSGGKVRRGWTETLERYRTRYVDAAPDNRSRMGKLKFWDLETSVLSDDVALVLGRWRLEETPEAGEGVFSLVFVRRGGNWQIIHDHTSVALPDPPPSASKPRTSLDDGAPVAGSWR